jgi:hypothetical protein
VTEVPPQTASAPRPKRRYTVSAKVLAANRRNLEKANAAPKEVRYRLTPKRLVACRDNLRKAPTARKAARPPRRGAWSCRSVLRAARRWGQNIREQLQAQKIRLMEVLAPKNEGQTKLAEATAEAFGRWVSLLREQIDRERAGLLRIWALAPQDARSAAQLAYRLVGLFRDEAWVEPALDRLALRLRRLGKLFWEMQNIPQPHLQEALAETSAEALGNPFRPMDSPRMAALLAEPAPQMRVGPDNRFIVLPEIPAEQPLDEPRENLQSARQRDSGNDRTSASDSEAATRNVQAQTHTRTRRGAAAEEWPATFEDYQALVQRSLGAGEELAPLVEQIARLSWDRHAVLEFARVCAFTAMEERVEQCCPQVPAYDVVDFVLAALRGEDFRKAQSQARQLEKELAEDLGDYLERRYGAQSAGDHEPGRGDPDPSTGVGNELASEPRGPKPTTRITNPVSEPQDPTPVPPTP